MQVDVNGTRLWFDVDGPSLVPDGPIMATRPTVVLLHGGPGSYDHSYFKPDFARLARLAQVVYLDLRDHGRSARHDPANWTFEVCADDVRAFCDALGIARPIVYGHSMGGFVAMLYGAAIRATPGRSSFSRRWPGSTSRGSSRASVASAVTRLRDLAERDYGGDPSQRRGVGPGLRGVRAAGTGSRGAGRRIGTRRSDRPGWTLLRRFDVLDQLARVDCPTLVCVGELDPVTPVAAAREIVDALRGSIGRLEVIEGAGHFPWKDEPGRYWAVIEDFVAGQRPATP